MKIREIHPEVCFWAFNSQQPMRYPKRKPMGVQERTAILEQEEHGTRALLQRVRQKTLRAQVRDDDVLDALAGYVTARASVSNQLTFFGDGSATDECGLPMEMVYRTTPLAYQVKP
jgi:predicted RNase H-like nuclease